MGTFLFNEIVFGPVKSRRLGKSLGVNILPVSKKFCNFNCLYCECGFNPKESGYMLPTRSEIQANLEAYFIDNNDIPDAITFAGNGEPTIHPEFPGIIEDVIACRNKYAPQAKVVVLSNATMLHKNEVFDALLKVDQNIQKIDSGFGKTVQLINQNSLSYSLENVIERLKLFNGKVIIQTLFIRGSFEGQTFDNTSELELTKLIEVYKSIKPDSVMVYRIERDTPAKDLEKIDSDTLLRIGKTIEDNGIKTIVSY